MRRRFFANKDDLKNYLNIEMLEDGTISFRDVDVINGHYCINNNWKRFYDYTKIDVCAGDIISFKANDLRSTINGIFVISSRFNVSGNLTAVTNGILKDYTQMFSNTSVVSVAKDFLSYTTLTDSCYSGMFEGCTSLVTAPELPATTLANYCYYNMFNGCTSLVTAPELPATTLTKSCYSEMFYGCTSLTTAPKLPATTLEDHCYYCMFNGCTSLVTAPELPATTLANYCYSYMFKGCTKLNYIKALFVTKPSDTYTGSWVSGVSETGTFVKNKNATWDVTGSSGVPSGWIILTE